MSDTLLYLFLAACCGGLAVASAVHWRTCYRRGRVYNVVWYERAKDPFNFWLSMVMLGVAAAGFLGTAVGFAGGAVGLWK